MDKELYFDNAATTPVDSVAKAAVDVVLWNHFHNPSSQYAVEEKRIIDEAAKNVAEFIGAKPEEIYFTSGATESNNWAIRGWIDAQKGKACRVITSAIEHPSVYNTVMYNDCFNAMRRAIGVDSFGFINMDEYKQCVFDTNLPTLVTIGMANNEIGTLQDIKTIVDYAHDCGAVVHTDATQYLPHFKVDVKALHIDMLSGSGHKFGCPKGIGFLYIREGLKINNLMYGGKQQQGARPGTENIAYIHALGKVIELGNFPDNSKLVGVRGAFMFRLYEAMGIAGFKIRFNGVLDFMPTLPNIISVEIEGIKANELLTLLAEQGIYVSAGSACSSGTNNPSRVLKAIGLTDEQASSVIRISLGDETSEERKMLIEALVKACKSYKMLNS